MTFWYFYIFCCNLNITDLFNLSLSINDTSSLSLSINDISMTLWYFYIFYWNLNMFPFCLWMFMRFFLFFIFRSFVFSNVQNYIWLKYNRYHTNIKKNSYLFSILYFDNQNRGFLIAIFLLRTYFHSKLHLWEQCFNMF